MNSSNVRPATTGPLNELETKLVTELSGYLSMRRETDYKDVDNGSMLRVLCYMAGGVLAGYDYQLHGPEGTQAQQDHLSTVASAMMQQGADSAARYINGRLDMEAFLEQLAKTLFDPAASRA